MNLSALIWYKFTFSIPRVSGDEPIIRPPAICYPKYSPRERG